jgi:hypothetical protein
MTGGVQRALVESQAREVINRASTCPDCRRPLRRNGSHRVRYRTPFGRLDLDSPRFYRCRCQVNGRRSFSPLALWLGGHTSPGLQYLEAQFAALLSYGASARILSTVLPLKRATSITTWKRHVARVGGRLDEEAHQRLASQPILNEFGLPTLLEACKAEFAATADVARARAAATTLPMAAPMRATPATKTWDKGWPVGKIRPYTCHSARRLIDSRRKLIPFRSEWQDP